MQGARIWLPNIEGFFTSLGRLLESAEGQRNTKSKISGGGGGFVPFSLFMYVICCRLALFKIFMPCFRWF